MPDAFTRTNIRLGAENYRGDRTYFLTLCFQRRRQYGSNPRIAPWVVQQAREWSARYGFLVHAYCLMPDHLHMLVAGTSTESNLLAFVELFKQKTAFAFRKSTGKVLWQFKYYDHILRKKEAPESVAWYIWLNPVRKGLCKHAQDYPYSGSFTSAGTRLLQGFPREDWAPPWKKSRTT